jgi:hypothetical protein
MGGGQGRTKESKRPYPFLHQMAVMNLWIRRRKRRKSTKDKRLKTDKKDTTHKKGGEG